MADIPQPLRRLPIRKMPADSRYVSLFSDASNKSDITFSDGHKGLLPKSTKLYEVGVDNLTLSLNGLSMLTPSKTEPIILEVIALRTNQNFFFGNPQTWPDFPTDFRLQGGFGPAVQLLDTDVYTPFHQIAARLHEISEMMTQIINGFTTGFNFEWRNVLPFTQPHSRHLYFNLHSSGRLVIHGSRTFWSFFCIHIPNPHYRSGARSCRTSTFSSLCWCKSAGKTSCPTSAASNARSAAPTTRNASPR